MNRQLASGITVNTRPNPGVVSQLHTPLTTRAEEGEDRGTAPGKANAEVVITSKNPMDSLLQQFLMNCK